jgi:hypothetical protein
MAVYFRVWFFIFSIIFVLNATDAITQDLYLNEIMSSNGSTIADEDGDYEDWIEVYYAGEEPLNLNGYGLSDNYDQPFRWVFPDTTIQPGELMLIWASNKDRSITGFELHTNFAISSAGEEVILTHPDGTRLDELSPIEIPTDISIGRQPDGTGEWVFFTHPTPGDFNNTDGYSERLDQPQFSHEPGFYSEEFELEISHQDPGTIIYYTLDGSDPDENSNVYEGPIRIYDRSSEPNKFSMIPTNYMTTLTESWTEPDGTIRKGTVVRTKATKPAAISAGNNSTYFVNQNGADAYNLPVISISSDSLNLFDLNQGIYVPGIHFVDGDHGTGNYFQRGIEWEKTATIEFFENDGTLGFNQDIGLRIHGGWTRRLPQKSLRIYARNVYGESRINYPIFPELPYSEFNRLILRNSGNDFGRTMFMDAAAQSLIRHLNVETQAYRPVIVYLNGEYWGIHNIRERYDRHYLERVYGVDPNNLDILTGRNLIDEGSDEHFLSMIDFIENEDLSNDEYFDQVKKLMDTENFLDYYSAQIYYGNNDWPHNNIDYWRLRVAYDPDASAGHDGRWRWLLYDVDRSLGFSTHSEFDMIDWILRDHWSTVLIRNLIDNKRFYNSFINRLSDHLNTAFLPERVSSVIDSLKTPLEPEIDLHIARWRNHESRANWENRVQMMHTYAYDRPGYLRQHLHDHFELGEDITITVDVSSEEVGFVQVNSLDILSSTPGIGPEVYPWSGEYFSEIPVTLSSRSKPGYRFSHWEIEGEEPVYTSELTRKFDESTSIRAVFISKIEVLNAYNLTDRYYLFTEWDENEPAGTYPESMVFVYMNESDPSLSSEVLGVTSGAYDLDSRTRINGLGEDGISFINTSSPDGNPGYPGSQLGGAILSLDTQNSENIQVSWKAGTVLPNSRVYHLRLQYRIGNEGEFTDVPDGEGNPVEYRRNEEPGHTEFIGPVTLPKDAEGQPEVQLLWRYYFTGEQADEDSGQRSELHISQIHVTGIPGGDYPAGFVLREGAYRFESWPADTTAGSTPDHMSFVYMDEMDPSLTSGILGFTAGGFNFESRTRITGLGENGIAFINTSNQQGNPGYPGTRLGGALLGLDTRDRASIEVSFTAGTVLPNSRIYNLRLQYRVGNEGQFMDVEDENGNPVEYTRNETAGHSEEFGPVFLPVEAENQEYVQLLWRYYYTGERVDEDSGQRAKLHISDIKVEGRVPLFEGEPIPDDFALHQNYPNPFNPGTTIMFDLPHQEHVRVEIFNTVGQRVALLLDENRPAGTHRVPFDASSLASGVYIYRINAGSFIQSRRMTFIK